MKISIDKWTYGGSGLGRVEDGSAIGTAMQVPFSLPGEIVEVKVIGEKDPIGHAELIDVLQASPNRVSARCPHFGACGGCQYQHVEYRAQVGLKLGILRETLHAAGLTNVPEPQLHTAEPWGYRNRIRLRVGVINGELRVGYNRRGSHDMLPIRECPIAAPLLMRAADALLTVAASSPSLALWSRQFVEVELFTDGEQRRLQMTLFLRSDRRSSLAAFCEQMKAIVPELAGAGVIVVGDSGHREQPGARWGADGLTYKAAGRDYWVSRGSFFQVNRFLVDSLVELVTNNRSGTLAWDLYAGVGLFSRALCESFTEVVAVETVAGDLATVLKGRHRAVGATAADFLRGAVVQRDTPDLVVMDPPRAGVGAEVCELLGRLKAPQMVYVSCDPITLARDLKAMVDSGYTIHEVHMVDLFPQTFHMETVVVLGR